MWRFEYWKKEQVCCDRMGKKGGKERGKEGGKVYVIAEEDKIVTRRSQERVSTVGLVVKKGVERLLKK